MLTYVVIGASGPSSIHIGICDGHFDSYLSVVVEQPQTKLSLFFAWVKGNDVILWDGLRDDFIDVWRDTCVGRFVDR